MNKFIVLFDRDGNDHVLPRDANTVQRFTQLVRELNDGDDVFAVALLGHIRSATLAERDILAVSIRHDGDSNSLCVRLQKAYDENGVDGFFEICADDAAPMLADPCVDSPGYAARVAELEAEGMTASDAQAVADAEIADVETE